MDGKEVVSMVEKNMKISNLSKIHLKPDERITLEMIVLDRDKKRAADFLSNYGLSMNNSVALNYCKKWFKSIEKREKGKLNIRYTDKGPRMDIS